MSSPHPSHLPPRPAVLPQPTSSTSKRKKAEKGVHTPKGSIEGVEEGWRLTFPRDGRRGSLGMGSSDGIGNGAEKSGAGKGKKTAEDIVSLVKSFGLTSVAPKWSLANVPKPDTSPTDPTSPGRSLDKAKEKEAAITPAPTAPIFIPFRPPGVEKKETLSEKIEGKFEEGPLPSIDSNGQQRWASSPHAQQSTSDRSFSGTSFVLSSPIFGFSDDELNKEPKRVQEIDRIASMDIRKIWEDEDPAQTVSKEYRPVPSRHAEHITPPQPFSHIRSEPTRHLPNIISSSDTTTSPAPDFLSTPGFGGFYQVPISGQLSSSATPQQQRKSDRVDHSPQTFILPQTSNWSQWETPRTAPYTSSQHVPTPTSLRTAAEDAYVNQLSPQWRPRYNDAAPYTPVTSQTPAFAANISSVERGLSPMYRFATPGVEVRAQSGRSEREVVLQIQRERERERERDETMRTPVRGSVPRLSSYGGGGSTGSNGHAGGTRAIGEGTFEGWAGMAGAMTSTSVVGVGAGIVGMSAGVYDPGPPAAVPFAQGDWLCKQPYCDYHNFSRNVNCRACGADKPWEGPPPNMPNSPPLGSVGDWRCECGFINWRRRSLCLNCYPDHPTNGRTSGTSGSGSSGRGVASSIVGQLSPAPTSPSQIWMGHTHALGGRAGEEWQWDRGVGEVRRGLDDAFARAITPTVGNGEGRRREENVFSGGIWGERRGVNAFW